MSSKSEFDRFIQQLRVGDNDAARLIIDRFGHRLAGLADKQMGPSIRRKVDPQDAIQSAYKSFFRCCRNGQFQLDDWDSIWLLLARITLRKCRKQARYFRAKQREMNRETPLHFLEKADHLDHGLQGTDPSPPQTASLHELLEQVLLGFSNRDRQIVKLNQDGLRVWEISARVACTERTVQRVLQRLRKQLENTVGDS